MVKYHIPLNYLRILLVGKGKKYSETPSTSTLPAVQGWETPSTPPVINLRHIHRFYKLKPVWLIIAINVNGAPSSPYVVLLMFRGIVFVVNPKKIFILISSLIVNKLRYTKI